MPKKKKKKHLASKHEDQNPGPQQPHKYWVGMVACNHSVQGAETGDLQDMQASFACLLYSGFY